MKLSRLHALSGLKFACCAGVLVAASVAAGQTSQQARDSIDSSVRQAQTNGGGAAYAGRIFDPKVGMTTHGRAGSAQPAFREARRGRMNEVSAPPDAVFNTPADEFSGDISYESGEFAEMPGGCDGGCGGDCDSCGGCGIGDCGGCGGCDYCDAGCDECVPLCLPRFKYLSLWAGVHAFKGRRDVGAGNNFGFQEGFNLGGRAPFFPNSQLAYQVGYQAVQSRLYGDLARNTSEARSQQFLTAGLFRRKRVGLQGGAVLDVMWDDLDADMRFAQIRAEASLCGPKNREIGFMAAISTEEDGFILPIDNPILFSFQTLDQYTLFYRWRFCDCGEARVWAGFTNDSDGILGAEYDVPISDSLSLQGGFNFLIPSDDTFPNGAVDESWNIAMNIVWQPRRTACASYNSPFRPLFKVADNGAMFLQQITP